MYSTINTLKQISNHFEVLKLSSSPPHAQSFVTKEKVNFIHMTKAFYVDSHHKSIINVTESD